MVALGGTHLYSQHLRGRLIDQEFKVIPANLVQGLTLTWPNDTVSKQQLKGKMKSPIKISYTKFRKKIIFFQSPTLIPAPVEM